MSEFILNTKEGLFCLKVFILMWNPMSCFFLNSLESSTLNTNVFDFVSEFDDYLKHGDG